MMPGNADVFARMRYCNNLLVNRMFTEAGHLESYIGAFGNLTQNSE
jgi:hypothetical protein